MLFDCLVSCGLQFGSHIPRVYVMYTERYEVTHNLNCIHNDSVHINNHFFISSNIEHIFKRLNNFQNIFDVRSQFSFTRTITWTWFDCASRKCVVLFGSFIECIRKCVIRWFIGFLLPYSFEHVLLIDWDIIV